MALKQVLPDDRWNELRREVVALIDEAAVASAGGISVESEYLVIVARKRG